MKKSLKNKKGFTLVEIIIVIAIIAILAAAAMIAYGQLTRSAEENAEKASAGVIVRSLNTFNDLTGPNGTAQLLDSGALGATLPNIVQNDLILTVPPNLVNLDLTLTERDFTNNGSLQAANVYRWVGYEGTRFFVLAELP
jgi:prepilin-type N-terminal cleavage/methylation domain-containing protein